MKNKKTKAFLAVALFASSIIGILPTLAKAVDYDGKIAAQLATMEKYSHYTSSTPDEDKTSAASDELGELILKWAQNPDFLTAPLKMSQAKGLTVAQSKDKNLKTYTWDTMGGGTAHFFKAVFQSRVSPTKVVGMSMSSEEEGDLGACYDKVVSQRTTGGDTIYIVSGYAIGSSQDMGSVVRAYTIKNGKLQPAKVFKTKTKLLDSVDCANYYKKDDSRATIEFVDNDKTMKVPLNTDTKFTGQYLLYKFDGQKYAYAGNGK